MMNPPMIVSPLSLHFLQNHPQEAARTLEQFTPDQVAAFLEQVAAKPAADILRLMTPSLAVNCLSAMKTAQSAALLEQFSIERAAMLLRRMATDVRNDIIRAMSPVTANMIRRVLRYPAGTVGTVMNPNVFTVPETMHVDEVIRAVQKSHDQVRGEVYVVNERQQLVGLVFTRDLLVGDPDMPVKNIMQLPAAGFSARSSLAAARDHPEWKYRDILPVCDHAGMFIGVLKRGVMLDTLAREDYGQNRRVDFMSTTLVIAELLLETCSSLVALDYENTRQGQRDERNR